MLVGVKNSSTTTAGCYKGVKICIALPVFPVSVVECEQRLIARSRGLT